VHNYNPSCIQLLKKGFGKFTSCRTKFGAHKLVHSEPFLDYRYDIWQLLSALYSDVQKIFYIGAHLHSRPWATAVEFSSNLSAIYTKSCAQTFPPIYGFFKIFERNFAKLVALSDNNNQNYLVHLKGQSMLRNDVNIIKIDPKTTTQHLFKVCCHRTNSVPASERDKITKKNKQTPCFRTHSRRALYDLPQSLHGDRARWWYKKGVFIFRATHSFSYWVHGKIRPNQQMRGFSAITP